MYGETGYISCRTLRKHIALDSMVYSVLRKRPSRPEYSRCQDPDLMQRTLVGIDDWRVIAIIPAG